MGRDDDLGAVDALLRQNQRVNIVAAVGMGGVGKTELALQYALRFGDQFPGGVCWLKGQGSIAAQMIAFAQEYLGLEVPENVENPVAWCCQRWPGDGPVLMVVDDVQDYGLLKPLLPGNPRFRVLLTTRQAILPPGQRLPLEVLTLAAALELLQSLVGAERIAAEPTEAEALCEWVGRLPLGLELVGYYLSLRPELTIARLLQRLETKKVAAKALVETYPAMTAKRGVAAAFELSWEPLSAEAKLVAAALGLFAAAPVVWGWVEDTLKGLGNEGWDEETLEDAQVELLRVHFLKATGTGSATRYEVHPLVREFFAAKRPTLPAAADLPKGFAQTMVQIAKTIPQAVTLDVQARVAEAVPHLDMVAAQWLKMLAGANQVWYCTCLARLHQGLNQWVEAERSYKQALIISHTQLGPRHPDTATSLNNLAALYQLMGLSREAEPLFTKALEIRKAELGPCHPGTATSLNNLAVLYRAMDRYGEAEPLFTEALEIRKANLGDYHPDTAASLNNLARLYHAMSCYWKAEPLYIEALAIWKTEPEEYDLNIAISLNNLAALFCDIGRNEEAEPLYIQALEIRQLKLGESDPSTAQSRHNLAVLYAYMQRFSEAVDLMAKALSIREKVLIPDHPDILDSRNSLAAIQRDMDKMG